MKKTALGLVAAAVGLLAGTAGARPDSTRERFGEGGQFVLGLDRAMGLAFESWTSVQDDLGYDTGTGDAYSYTIASTYSETHVGVLGSHHLATGGVSSNALLPRFALDVFLIDGLSLGASFMFVSSTGEVESESDDPSFADGRGPDDPPSVQTLLVTPRVGYAFGLGKLLAFWPRAGITYARLKSEDADGNTTKITAFDLTVEGMLAITPVTHFAVLVGPFGDIALNGKSVRDGEDAMGDTRTAEDDFSMTAFGLSAGVVGYFP